MLKEIQGIWGIRKLTIPQSVARSWWFALRKKITLCLEHAGYCYAVGGGTQTL